jgi:hypothetical protein
MTLEEQLMNEDLWLNSMPLTDAEVMAEWFEAQLVGSRI